MANYDLPKAAPEPLRRVQLLVNSTDLENRVEWLPKWLAERGLAESELERARGLREALRALVLANNGVRLDQTSVAVINDAARRVRVEVSDLADVLVVSDGDALDDVVAVALNAMVDGAWSRLKACRNCRWCFYDESPNRSARWCSMQLCGNRKKTRAYRARRRAGV
ncbi:MAG TPA: CGNR zinc finger domain-containing protein [Gaiellaceae bacterium]|jgi:predicted RNA-binding Zn ribbon-like protein